MENSRKFTELQCKFAKIRLSTTIRPTACRSETQAIQVFSWIRCGLFPRFGIPPQSWTKTDFIRKEHWNKSDHICGCVGIYFGFQVDHLRYSSFITYHHIPSPFSAPLPPFSPKYLLLRYPACHVAVCEGSMPEMPTASRKCRKTVLTNVIVTCIRHSVDIHPHDPVELSPARNFWMNPTMENNGHGMINQDSHTLISGSNASIGSSAAVFCFAMDGHGWPWWNNIAGWFASPESRASPMFRLPPPLYLQGPENIHHGA